MFKSKKTFLKYVLCVVVKIAVQELIRRLMDGSFTL